MNQDDVRRLLEEVATGARSADDALSALRFEPFEQLANGLTLDTHRALRTGRGEVVFGPGKSPEQLVAAVGGLSKRGPVLATKLAADQGTLLLDAYPDGNFDARSGLFCLGKDLGLEGPWRSEGRVVVVTAGAADLPIGLEALGTARFLDLDAGLNTDVGVAGLHRIAPHRHALADADMLIVVAGMEGALPSVLAGLFGKPIVAVPTSVGYGASFGGLAALLGMLNACAGGIVTVNIDNGFGAAVFASMIQQQMGRPSA